MKSMPEDSVLRKISRVALGVRLGISSSDVLSTADAIVGGTLPPTKFTERPTPLLSYPHDFRQGAPTFQLIMASFELERILLDAYERTHDERYFDLALKRIVDFSRHESRARNADGFLWNDHAIAARISVLTAIWRHIRQRDGVPAEFLVDIVALVQRSGRLLAHPAHFTVRTNHGVMQNLALLQIGAAFPKLPEVPGWRSIAQRRLELQLSFYVSREGVVLEHSAGYHEFGTQLLGYAKTLMALNGMEIPPELLKKQHDAERFLTALERTDGSLPLIGNTKAQTGRERRDNDVSVSRNRPATVLAPLSGYALWNRPFMDEQFDSQLAVAWAKHDRHGHKHADEMSLHWWVNGTDLLTASGYWPYGAAGYAAANGWRGANAPHLIGEPADSDRSIEILASADVPSLKFISLHRTVSDGATFNRQVMLLNARTLVVLDFIRGAEKGARILWTTSPKSLLHRQGEASFRSRPSDSKFELIIEVHGEPAPTLSPLQGSLDPFGGWVVVSQHPKPAPALEATWTAPELSNVTTFSLASAAKRELGANATLSANAKPSRWELEIHDQGDPRWHLVRDANLIALEDVQKHCTDLVELAPPPDLSVQKNQLIKAMDAAIDAYPPWRDLSHYRRLVTYSIAGIFIGIEFILLMSLGLVHNQTRVVQFHAALLSGWVLMACWLHFSYFVA